jgi:hypothetical protein
MRTVISLVGYGAARTTVVEDRIRLRRVETSIL